MGAKEYLSQLRRLRSIYENKIARREFLYSLVKSAGVAGLKEDIIQTSQSLSKNEDITIECIQLSEEIDCILSQLRLKAQEMEKEINELGNSNYIELLSKHYIAGKDLLIISEEMNYSYIWTRKAHGKALLLFEQVHADKLKSIQKYTNNCDKV